MAVTTEKAAQLTVGDLIDGSDNKIAVADDAKLRFARFDFTQGAVAGDANSTADLVVFPPGRFRIIPAQSLVIHSALGASRTVDIGYLAYTKHDGTAVIADVDAFLDGDDMSAAGNTPLTLPVGSFYVDTKDGLTVQAIVLGGTLPAAATLSGWIAYTRD